MQWIKEGISLLGNQSLLVSFFYFFFSHLIRITSLLLLFLYKFFDATITFQFKKSENSYQRFKFPKKKIRTKEFLSQGINYIYPVEISMPFLLLWYIRRISFFPLFFFNLLSPDSNYFPISFVFLRRVLRCNDYFSV